MTEILYFNRDLTLGQKVRISRIARRWTQADLAYESNVTQNNVSSLERDLRIYPAAKIRILDALGLSEINQEKTNAT